MNIATNQGNWITQTSLVGKLSSVFKIWNVFLFMFITCMWGYQKPWNWSYRQVWASIWVQGTEPRSLRRAVSFLTTAEPSLQPLSFIPKECFIAPCLPHGFIHSFINDEHSCLSERFSHVLLCVTHTSVWMKYFMEVVSTARLSRDTRIISKPLLLLERKH